MNLSIERYNLEIKKNLERWNKKPLLREIYRRFYDLILSWIKRDLGGEIVELGSGIGNFKSACPECITTDIFPNPWIDRVESAYCLSFKDNSASNLIMFDVFHHLAFPGSALEEAKRILMKNGRIIIFEPYISIFGILVYGLFHHEPMGLFKKISWINLSDENPDKKYYAAQGNTTRIFCRNSNFGTRILKDWNIINIKKLSAIAYILSGGFSKPSLYLIKVLPFVQKIEKILDIFPLLFATRIMIVLEKK